MPLSSKRVSRSQGEDVDVVLSGSVSVDDDPLEIVVFDPAQDSAGSCTTARVMSLTFAIESNLLAILYWGSTKEADLILPLEGRGSLNFREYAGLQHPRNDGWTGQIILRVHSLAPYLGSDPRHFALAIDLSKQRS